jgi:nitrite reductase (NADH) large subunit
MTKPYDHLIVGNSAAGIAAIEAIRAQDATGSIAVISDENYPAYSTPLISYLIKGVTTEQKMHLRDDAFYERNGVDCIFGATVEELDPKAKSVKMSDGMTARYAKILFATGSTPTKLKVPALEGKKNVFSFLTLSDAQGIAARADEQMTLEHDAKTAPVRAVIVGAGLIGLKAAEGLAHRVDEVVVLVRSARILRTTVDEEASRMLIEQLGRKGVRILTDVEIADAAGAAGAIDEVMLTDGSTLSCALVIVAPGVRPNDEVVVAAGAEQGKGLVCGPDMQTTLKDVYAAGDCTQSHDTLSDIDRCLAIWPNAVAQGRVAGTCMAQGDARFEGGFGVNAFGFFGSKVLTCGIVNPDDSYEVTTYREGDTYRKFVFKDDRLFGYILLNADDSAGIYTMVIRDAIPVSSIAAGTFERGITLTDLPAELYDALLHKGMGKKGGAR